MPAPKVPEEKLRARGSWVPASRRKKSREDVPKRAKASAASARIIPKREMLAGIPGYDPCAQADGFRFGVARARKAVRFFHDRLTHVEGPKTGQPFLLEPWQQALVGNLFGWVDAAGLRRYREVILEVARKNGKTALAAGIVLYLLTEDGEGGPRLYSAAAETNQAALIYRVAAAMCRYDERLRERLRCYRTAKSIEDLEGDGVYRAISAEAGSKHGLNPSAVVVDELHAQDDRELVDVLVTAMGARDQPLLVHITTRDVSRESICNEKCDYARAVRDNRGDPSAPGYDPRFLPVLYEAGDEDDWTLRSTWAKANPNLGVSVFEDFLEREAQRAIAEPHYQNTFRRLHCNQKTDADVAAIRLADWDACPPPPSPAALIGSPCFAGLDLSHTTDLTSLAIWWPSHSVMRWWFWMPGDMVLEAERRDKVPYTSWVRDGLVEICPGNAIDPAVIESRCAQILLEHSVIATGYDRAAWGRPIAQRLQDAHGHRMVEMAQGHLTMGAPSKEFARLVAARQLAHGGHRVARWNASCLAWRLDVNGNFAPDKMRSKGRIDGIVAGIMAIARGASTENVVGANPYDGREVVI